LGPVHGIRSNEERCHEDEINQCFHEPERFDVEEMILLHPFIEHQGEDQDRTEADEFVEEFFRDTIDYFRSHSGVLPG